MITVKDESQKNSIISDLTPDLTPLIDVLFMLIVFLVLTTNTALQVFDVSIPKDSEKITQTPSSSENITITIFENKEGWAINEDKISDFNKFRTELLKKYKSSPNKKIYILSEKNAPIQKLLDILTYLRKHKIEAADIIMKQE